MWHHNHAQVHFCASQSSSSGLLVAAAGAGTGVCRVNCTFYSKRCIVFTFSVCLEWEKTSSVQFTKWNRACSSCAALAFTFSERCVTEGTAVGPVKQWESEQNRHLHLPLLCSVTHTDGPCTHTHTDALTDTMGCLPTSPITGLFIRVSYRRYWQPADTQSLQHKQMEHYRREGGAFWLRSPLRKTWRKKRKSAASSTYTSSHTHQRILITA